MTRQRDEAPTGSSSATEEAEPRPVVAGAQPEVSPPTAAAGRRRFRYTLPGAWVALVFACLAFTPSLLPRSALLQGVVCGITAAIGYGLGVAGAWTWRAFADRDPRPPRPGAWRVFAISAAVLLVVAIVLGQWWQAQIRDLMGAPTPNPLLLVLLPLAAAGLFTGLVALSRSLRGGYHRAAVRLQRWMGRRAARALGWVAVVTLTWLVASGLLLNGLATLADRSFSVRNTTTAEGVDPAHQRAAVGRPGVAGVVGVARPPGTDHRRHRPVGRGDRRLERVRSHGADPRLRRHRVRRATWRSGPSWPSTTWSGQGGSTAPTCWSPPPPAAAGWTRARSTASST